MQPVTKNMNAKNGPPKKVSETQKSMIKEIKFVRDSPMDGLVSIYICGINIMTVDVAIGEHISIELFQDKDVGLGFYKPDEYGIVRDRMQTIFWVGDIIANLKKLETLAKNETTNNLF